MSLYTRVVPVSGRLLLQHGTVYQEFYKICMISSYTSHKHFVQNMGRITVYKKSYEPLLVCVCGAHQKLFAISERGDQMFYLRSFYTSSNGIKYCDLFVKETKSATMNIFRFLFYLFLNHS